MTTVEEAPTLSNAEVANDLNLSPSGVSRLRSGERFPSLSVMQAIEKCYGWSVQEQADARRNRVWHQDFALVLQERREVEDAQDAPSGD